MARHDIRDNVTGRWAKTQLPTGSTPHRTSRKGGKSDTDREMERNSQESAKWNEGRWDEDAEMNASARDGLEESYDWKGRGNTVRGVWQGSQHRRVHAGYDVAEHVRPSEVSNYTPENVPRFPDVKPHVFDARATQPRKKPEPGNDHESFLTGGR